MPAIVELIRQSAVPANTMRLAARGALELPPAETIEVLVEIAAHPVFGEEARLTLAAWDEFACMSVCADPRTPPAVLEYFLAPQNRRPRLLPALLDNPAVAESQLLSLSQEHSPDTLDAMLASSRVCASANVLQAVASNPALTPAQQAEVQQELSRQAPADSPADDAEADAALDRYLREYAAEILAEQGKVFRFAVETPEDEAPAPAAHAQAASAASRSLNAAEAALDEGKRMSPLQRIARLSVGERVQLAMKGNKEERYILVRDGSKVVSCAVLESPKLTDQEVELFASLKNVQETVLRGIAAKRKFMKLYAVVRALVNNPRCPLDVQLTLIKNLLPNDLRALSTNKNVSDTIRKLAWKLHAEKSQNKKPLG